MAIVRLPILLTVLFWGCGDDAPPADAGRDTGVSPREDAAVPPDDEPHKGPWALGVTTTAATIRWESQLEVTAVEVELTPEADGASITATGTSTAVEVTVGWENLLVPDPADYDRPGTYHMNEVRAEGLAPGTCYTYALVGYDEHGGRVCTGNEPTDHTTPVRFLALGDTSPVLGVTGPLLEQALPMNPSFVVHAGDLQYYAAVAETWQLWFREMAPMLEQGAFFPCVGNHEEELDGREFSNYHGRFFADPGEDGDVFAYHYQSGGVHFFALNTEEQIGPSQEGIDWLVTRLGEVEAEDGYRFSIVYYHHPIYTLAQHRPKEDFRALFEPAIEPFRVPLVLAGHNHAYERFVVGDVTYVTTGGGGSARYGIDDHLDDYPEDALLRVAAEREHHAIVFEIVDRTIHGDVVGVDGTILDAFDITVP